ncbi:hypothetical protein HPB49_023926 [Dermacentor silvarum]|uniref:Uncharacterized protein n=1 Tax=Dermacentor silvarum TaxID=543639 RepID=A0ACB8DGP7_DERSI|nr:hypothetical protein HPB49_023926 [Dermacentor silvarum]
MRARIEAGVVHSPYPYCPPVHDTSFYGFLMERLLTHGCKTALICGHDKVTYLELRDKLRLCAAWYRRQGIGKGDRVYVHVDNSIESFVAVCGVPLTGATLVSSDCLWSEGEILDKIKMAAVTHVLTDENHAEMFTRIKKSCNIKDMFLVGQKKPGFTSVCEFNDEHQEPFDDKELLAGGSQFVGWTTGTTGAPKCVQWTESLFLGSILGRAAVQLLTPKDVFLGDSNISCIWLFTIWLLALHVGSTIVVSKACGTVPEDAIEAFKHCEKQLLVFREQLADNLPVKGNKRNKPKANSSVEDLARASDGEQQDALRAAVGAVTEYTEECSLECTPEKSELLVLKKKSRRKSTALAEELVNTFKLDELRSGYGMAEGGGCLTTPPSGEVSGTNQGFPFSSTKMKVIDVDTGKVLGPLQRGELLFNTPYAPTCYCGDTEVADDRTDEHGWIHSGDLGYYDHDGRLFVCGRLKTLLECQRRKFPPSDIEHCLMDHEAVEEVSVLGMPFAELQQFPAAVVVTKSGFTRDQQLAEDLKRYVAGTSSFKYLLLNSMSPKVR